MAKIKKGSIVKFTDPDGFLDGGIVVDFTRKDNVEYLLINNLEGKNIAKKRTDVQLIERQRRGRVPVKFMEDLKAELHKANEAAGLVREPQMGGSEEQPKESVIEENLEQSKVENDNNSEQNLLNQCVEIDYLNKLVRSLEAENKSLRNKISELELINSNVKLILTIKGLGNALTMAALEKEADVVAELLKVINQLNDIEDD